MTRAIRFAIVLSLVTAVTGCGGASDAPAPVTSQGAALKTVVGGTILGLADSGLRLGNAGAQLTVAPGATTFQFENVATGAGYDVKVLTTPVNQACVVRGGTGTVGDAGSTSVRVECSTMAGNTKLLRGVVSGLKGRGLDIVQANEDELEFYGPTTEFFFPTALPEGQWYSIGISRQPKSPAQTCTIQQAKGRVPDGSSRVPHGDPPRIVIDCLDNDTVPLSGTYRFEPAPGKRGYLTFFPDGTYSLVVRMDDPRCGSNDGNGVEYGIYTWNLSGDFAIRSAVVDTNGSCGMADSSSGKVALFSGTLTKTASGLTISRGTETLSLSPVVNTSSDPISVLGSWATSTGAEPSTALVLGVTGAFTVFEADGTYVAVETQFSDPDYFFPGGQWGCYVNLGEVLVQDCGPDRPSPLDLVGIGGGLTGRGYGEFNFNHTGEDSAIVDRGEGGPPRAWGAPLDYYWFRILPR